MGSDVVKAALANPVYRDRLAQVAAVLLASEGAAVGSPDELIKVFAPMLVGFADERVAVAAFDRRGRLIDAAVLTVGCDGFVICDTKQVLRWALTRKRTAHSFAVAHNHPSGDPTLSAEDIACASRLRSGATAVGLVILDFLAVVDSGGYRGVHPQWR